MLSRYHTADDGTRLAYGDKPAAGPKDLPDVVLLPSLHFGRGMFDAMVALMRDRRRILLPDHRGQGDSEIGPVAPTMERLALDVIDLLEAQVRGRVHLVGCSMGGYVAMEVALRRPDLVLTCALTCCACDAEKDVDRFSAVVAALRTRGSAHMVEPLLHIMLGQHFLDEGSLAERARWHSHFAALPPHSADAMACVAARPSYRHRLSELRMPMLLISGALDRAKRPDDMAQIARYISGSRHVVFEHSGHTPAVEEPHRLALELEAFWHLAEQ